MGKTLDALDRERMTQLVAFTARTLTTQFRSISAPHRRKQERKADFARHQYGDA